MKPFGWRDVVATPEATRKQGRPPAACCRWFISSNNSDVSSVQQAFVKGHEIATHTVRNCWLCWKPPGCGGSGGFAALRHEPALGSVAACLPPSRHSLSIASSSGPILQFQANNAADSGFDEILDARFWLNQVRGWFCCLDDDMRPVPEAGPTPVRHCRGLDLPCESPGPGIPMAGL